MAQQKPLSECFCMKILAHSFSRSLDNAPMQLLANFRMKINFISTKPFIKYIIYVCYNVTALVLSFLFGFIFLFLFCALVTLWNYNMKLLFFLHIGMYTGMTFGNEIIILRVKWHIVPNVEYFIVSLYFMGSLEFFNYDLNYYF